MVDLRLFDILKVNFKDSITFSHPLSHCPPLMTAPLTSNVVKGLAASLWRDRDDPWPRAADPGSSRTSRFIQPHVFNRTRKIKKIAFLTTWMRRWTLMLCLVCDTRSHRGETSQADLTQLPSLTTGYSNSATWEPFALLYDSFPCTHTVNIHQRVSAHYSTADRFCNDAFLVWISWIKPTTIIVFFFFLSWHAYVGLKDISGCIKVQLLCHFLMPVLIFLDILSWRSSGTLYGTKQSGAKR